MAGKPVPEGSTKAFYLPKLKKTVTTHQNKKQLDPWRNRIATEAQHADELRRKHGLKPFLEPGEFAYVVSAEFTLSEPPSHPKSFEYEHTVKPDLDKLVRAINDALTGVLWHDDSAVVRMAVSKEYASPAQTPGVLIEVEKHPRRVRKAKEVRL